MNKRILLTFFLMTFLLPSLKAQEAAGKKKETHFSLGYGLAIKKNNRTGNTYKNGDKNTLVQSIPMVQFSYGRLSLGPQGLAYRVAGNPAIGFSAILNLAGERYEAPGMKGRKKSLFGGGLFKWKFFSLMMSGDLGDKSGGLEAQVSYNEVFVVTNELLFRTSLFLEWHDRQYTNYYFGVRPEEATPERPGYRPGPYLNPGTGFISIYKLSEDFAFYSGLNIKYVPEKIRRSPTVNEDNLEAGAFLGLNYHWR